MSETENIEREWSHFIDAATIDEVGKRFDLSPEGESVSALCNRLNLYGIPSLTANLSLKRNGVSKFIHVSGRFTVNVTQKCVVTTDPVEEHLKEEFEAWFSEPNQAVSFAKARRERMSLKEQNDQPMLEEHEDPEPIIDGKIDLGELIVQHISLALNPYPRCEGVEFDGATKGLEDAPDGTYNNPFAALKDWKKKESDKDA